MNKSGFTLIEILVSLGIFVVGFASVMSLMFAAYSSHDRAVSLFTQSLVAQNFIEKIREAENEKSNDSSTNSLREIISEVTQSVGPDTIRESTLYPGIFYDYRIEYTGAEQVSSLDERAATWDCVKISIWVFDLKYISRYRSSRDSASGIDMNDFKKYGLYCFSIINKTDMPKGTHT